MTNREMVREPGRGRAMPEPNSDPRLPVPAPESEDRLLTTDDPPDSPQPNPMINLRKTQGLREPSR